MTERSESAGLIERLRDACDDRGEHRCEFGVGHYWNLCDEAADALEQQAAEIARLREQLAERERGVRIESPGRCEAIVPEKWYSESHQCPFAALSVIDGKKLCGTHARTAAIAK